MHASCVLFFAAALYLRRTNYTSDVDSITLQSLHTVRMLHR